MRNSYRPGPLTAAMFRSGGGEGGARRALLNLRGKGDGGRYGGRLGLHNA